MVITAALQRNCKYLLAHAADAIRCSGDERAVLGEAHNPTGHALSELWSALATFLPLVLMIC